MEIDVTQVYLRFQNTLPCFCLTNEQEIKILYGTLLSLGQK